jgi:biopolymer transport protein ExbD
MIRKRKRADLVLPLTSFGDIAFLMIIFFMLASNFMKTANMELTEPRSSGLEKQEPAKASVVLDEEGVLWYEGAVCTSQELVGLLKERAEDLRGAPVHVRIHAGHPRRTFMPIIEAVSEAGVKMVLTGELEE